MSKVAKTLDKGGKRILIIALGVTFIASLAVVSLVTLGRGDNEGINTGSANLGRLNPSVKTGSESAVQPSLALQEKLERVHKEEAEAARVKGASYIPEVYIGTPEEIRESLKTGELEERIIPSYQHYQQAGGNSTHNQSVSNSGMNESLEKAVLDQMAYILGQMDKGATVSAISINYKPERNESNASSDTGGGNNQANNQGNELVLIQADEILTATLLTPIDTYVTNFTLAEITGGPFNGAQLRGQVVPMSASGDVEDVGIRFTSMTIDGNYYPIDAIALNEQTATDAMDGKLDRRIFSRYVMPVVAATFSGIGTYFTARGSTEESLLRGDDYGESIIVQREKATKEDAKYQAYGDAIDKASQLASNAINREASRPQRVTLSANAPIGVIFNAPVMSK